MPVRPPAAAGHVKAPVHVAPCIHEDRVHVLDEIQSCQGFSQSPYGQHCKSENNSIMSMWFHALGTVRTQRQMAYMTLLDATTC